MKKIVLAALIMAFCSVSCSERDNKNAPAGGAGKDQAPTTTSADSSNGYGDKSADSTKR